MQRFYIIFQRNDVRDGSPIPDSEHCWTFDSQVSYLKELDFVRKLDHLTILFYGPAFTK